MPARLMQIIPAGMRHAYAGLARSRATGAIMKTNEGTLDRALRVLVGVLLIGMAVAGVVGPWGYIGIVPLLTGAVGYCPLYSLLGISSCPTRGT
jgi:hypothetical protein